MPVRLAWELPEGATGVKVYNAIEETGIIHDDNLIATVNSPTVQYDDSEPELTLEGTCYAVVPVNPSVPKRTQGMRISLPSALLDDLDGIVSSVTKLAIAQAAIRGYFLDFENNIYWRAGTRYNSFTAIPNLTVSRASSGTAATANGGVTSFGNNIARITDQGITLEDSATNLVPESHTFSVANGSNIASTSIVSPSGASDATRFDTLQSSFGEKILGSIATVASNTLHASAVYVRGEFGTKFTFYARNDDGLTAQTPANQITFTGSWQRIDNMLLTTAADNTTMRIIGERVDANDDATYVEIWGGQIEEGGASTSFIPTTGSPVTRAAETVSFTNIPSSYPLAVYARVKRHDDVSAEKIIATLDSGAGDDEVNLLFDSSYRAAIYTELESTKVGDSRVTGTLASDTFHQIAGRVELNNVIAAANTTAATADTTAALPTAYTRLILGASHTGSPLNGVISQFMMIPGPNGIGNDVLADITSEW